jgi:hypothetical protein
MTLTWISTSATVIHSMFDGTKITILDEMMISTKVKGPLLLFKVSSDSLLLIWRNAEDVWESSSAREPLRGYLVQLLARSWRSRLIVAVPFCTPDGQDVGTGTKVVWSENLAGSAVADLRTNPRITGWRDNGHAL